MKILVMTLIVMLCPALRSAPTAMRITVTAMAPAPSPADAAVLAHPVQDAEAVKPAAQATRSYEPLPEVNFREPAREYVERSVDGWKLQLERDLVERYPDDATRVVDRLQGKLGQTLELLPEHTRPTLRWLTLFVMAGPDAPGGGRDNGAEYCRSIDPDYHPQLDPRWRSAMVVYSAANYLQQSEQWAVQMLLHEFAHAWQLERWPEKQPEIWAAWQHANDQGLYRNVKDVNGNPLAAAYALQNQLEYFAELSCAYFWRGEYEPFDREALRQYDPVGFAMIETMWGVHQPPPPISEKAGLNE